MTSTQRGYTAGDLIYRSRVLRFVTSAVAITLGLGLLAPRLAHAEDAPPPQPLTEEQAKAAIEGGEKKDSLLPEAPPEAPPPPPRHKGFVIEQTLGALGFIGQFGKIAHPAFYMHTQFGYELFSWLMLFAEGEFAFTDTSLGTDPTKSKAFPIFGFGGGPRITIRPTERFAFYFQGCVGGIMADVPSRVLGNLGFINAESLGFYAGGRVGIEWYQVDRHIALGLAGGTRFLPSFKKTVGSDTPLGWDAEASLRYTF